MLRIEKVYLQGFKSFCDPTEIIFDQEAITAVVGPNGCGKSNVSDAISWVIGEQKAKALRGSRMEDFIFQGSRNRPPAGLAEVILTMVVRQGFSLTPPAFGVSPDAAEPTGEISRQPAGNRQPAANFQEGERITVGRRLYRTGESEYEMNGRACRLRDIQELFAGTGLGGAHYAIIEQGRIGQVLSAKPLDRRALIEEAAGISRFRMRQRSAELKLEATRQNLSRITDILAEVDRQQNSLKRQAARARRYQRLREQIRELLRTVYASDYLSTRHTITSLEDRLATTAALESEQLSQITEMEGLHSEVSGSASRTEEALGRAREAAAATEVELERTRQQKIRIAEQLQALSSQSSEFSREQEIASERSSVIANELSRLRAELRRLEEEINNESAALISEEQSSLAAIEKDQEAERTLNELQHNLYQNATQLERWRQLERQFTESVERCEERLRGLAAEGERATSQLTSTMEQHQTVSAGLEASLLHYRELDDRLNAVGTQIREEDRRQTAIQSALASLQHNLAAAEQRHQSLSELDHRRAYFPEAVQTVMRQAGEFTPEVAGHHTPLPHQHYFQALGTLADFVQVAPGNESLIESVLHEELQYLLVPGFDDALSAIEYLKTSEHGRATFLVVGLHGGESHPALIGPPTDPDAGAKNDSTAAPGQDGQSDRPAAPEQNQTSLISLLGLRPELQAAFERALPQLARAIIVDNETLAIEQSAADNSRIFLTKTGLRATAGHLITGGSSTEKGTGILTLKREIAELRQRITSLSAEVTGTELSMAASKEKLSGLTAQSAELDAKMRKLEQEIAVLRAQLQQAEKESERASTHLQIVRKEATLVETERQEFSRKLEHASREASEAEHRQAQLEQRISAGHSTITELRREAESRNSRLATRRADFAALTERRRGLQNDLRRLENESRELEEKIGRQQMTVLQTKEKLSELNSTASSVESQIQELEARRRQAAQTLEQLTLTLTDQRRSLETTDQSLRRAREQAMQSREERAQIEVALARQSAGLHHLTEACRNDLGEEIEAICDRLEQYRQSAQQEGLERYQTQEQAAPQPEAVPETEGEPADEDAFRFGVETEAAKRRLAELRAKIENLGPVNLVALDELSQTSERLSFLASQKADIERAIADTQTAIAEIKRRSRERFREAFTAINANFAQTFQELFGGGHGEMRLIDENDILESGIEIIARPPGKRLQNVLLLSGGEKAMTAIALVMAIFKYRPSPFCLLDEVDAPLDEVNIGRFADKIVEMSRQTQFMIITHSKRTMEAARTLYGVTMEDPGVSKLVSVRLA